MSTTTNRMRSIVRAIEAHRIPTSSEAEAQRGVELALIAAGLVFEPQKVIPPGERIDVMCGGVAIEIKVRGPAARILSQLERYAACDEVYGLVLVTSTPWASAAGEIGGKPFRAVSLGRSWL